MNTCVVVSDLYTFIVHRLRFIYDNNSPHHVLLSSAMSHQDVYPMLVYDPNHKPALGQRVLFIGAVGRPVL